MKKTPPLGGGRLVIYPLKGAEIMKRIAFIGDIHGALNELNILHRMLQNYSLDAIEHCGDLIDRGPDPAGVLRFCRERKIHGVMGNHESVILDYPRKKTIPRNPDKARSLEAIYSHPENLPYIESLPFYKLHGERLIQTHAGMNPFQPMHDQRMNNREHIM